jgi:hypothetical protein
MEDCAGPPQAPSFSENLSAVPHKEDVFTRAQLQVTRPLNSPPATPFNLTICCDGTPRLSCAISIIETTPRARCSTTRRGADTWSRKPRLTASRGLPAQRARRRLTSVCSWKTLVSARTGALMQATATNFPHGFTGAMFRAALGALQRERGKGCWIFTAKTWPSKARRSPPTVAAHPCHMASSSTDIPWMRAGLQRCGSRLT